MDHVVVTGIPSFCTAVNVEIGKCPGCLTDLDINGHIEKIPEEGMTGSDTIPLPPEGPLCTN